MAGSEEPRPKRAEVRVVDETPGGVRLRIYDVDNVETLADGSARVDATCRTGNPGQIILNDELRDRVARRRSVEPP